jgi:hypothetical protein
VHATFSAETIPATCKTQSFFDFDENSVISFLIKIFRRFNALFTNLYTPNVLHATFSVETIPATRKKQSFVDNDENSAISFLIEIFR